MGRQGAAGREGTRGDAGTDLIDEADGIHAILRDEVTAAAAEPSEHRGPPTLAARISLTSSVLVRTFLSKIISLTIKSV